ncbi:FKBP-type 22 kDa peptidyl-prolyl cis-trans isomerase [BD1-7 clade bacterium]|uniref:Peptidyl-prolyl cis-trans isomerase n=1 Tax=BD1-7 clade bacterium TaxID=2029982 RepID=A0A5S9PMK3_9GAMM|nr:FKBP-type 22 kDa peptidyl-prolyl cis-trans isomerase [BD1-7 clade bacterium]CAA0105152.1 FKBP-type 22 kDa peptidyl-prolyl cis-trans isomerase [BD1-7 clade bacterium]
MTDASNNVLILVTVIIIVWLTLGRMRKRQRLIAQRVLSDAFLKENAQHDDVLETASGLQYTCLHDGGGEGSPSAADKVRVHYHGTLTDGTVFDSSVDRGQPIDFGLQQVIAGWTEGLQLMKPGDKFRLFIPSRLAYGNRSMGQIPGGAALIFDVELIAINP